MRIYNRRGALVVSRGPLDPLTPNNGRLPPGTEEGGVSRRPGVGPKKLGSGSGTGFCFAGGADEHFALIGAGPPMVRGAIEREQLPYGHRCCSSRRGGG